MERGFACADPPQLAKPLKPETQPANTRSSAGATPRRDSPISPNPNWPVLFTDIDRHSLQTRESRSSIFATVPRGGAAREAG